MKKPHLWRAPVYHLEVVTKRSTIYKLGCHTGGSMVKSKKSWAVVALAVSLACAVHAQKLPTQLLEATKTAVLSSPDVQERWKAFRASEYGVAAAAAQRRPQVDATAYAGIQARETGATNFGTANTNGAELTLTQLLFNGGGVAAAVAQADEQRLRTYYELRETSEGISLAVFRAYVDLLRFQELVEVATENYVEHKTTTDLMQERVKATIGARVDLEQAQARLAKAETALVEVTMGMHNAGARYLRAVGVVAPKNLPAWPETLKLAKMPESAIATLNQGLKGHPGVQAAYQNVKAADHFTEARNSAFMPRIEARAVAATDKNLNGANGRESNNRVELALTQNLYRGGADTSAKTRATELALRARAQLEQACRDARQTLSIAYKDVYTYNEQLRMQDVHRLSAEKARVAYRQQFEIGQRTLLDLLDTQAEYFDATSSYTNTRFDQLIAQARTLAGMGQLVAALGAQRGDWPSAQDLGQDPADLGAGAVCPLEAVPMRSLDELKAELAAPKRSPCDMYRPHSYVALLRDLDGKVGKAFVRGPKAERTLERPNTGAELDGASVFNISNEMLDCDFRAALAAQPPVPTRFTVRFLLGKDQFSPEGEEIWPQVMEAIKRRPTVDLTIEGHTDTLNTPEFNEVLSLKRAKAVEQKLREAGLGNVPIEIQYFGETMLEVQTPDETDEPRNRRAVISVR
jgi:outer membrane protein, adhesin transport system